MLDIYKSIGIEKIVEDEELFEKLNQRITDNVRYVIPGYACDYYLHTFPGEIEFEQCRSFDGGILGTDIHFSGNDKMFLIFDKVISNNGTVHYYQMHNELSQEAFPVRVICPDVLPDTKTGDKFYGQIVAFSGDQVQYIANEVVEDGYVRDNGNGNVIIAGRISSVDEWEFEFEDVRAEFYELEVETKIGRIAVVALKDKIANPEEDAFICCEALLSYDVALEPERFDDAPFARDKYAEAPFDIPFRLGSGFIPNYKNAVKVFANCVENHAFHRFPRACAESVSFHDGINCSVIDNGEVEKSISAIVLPTSKECNIMHILSSDFDELLGWDALVIGNEAEPVAAFAISINKFGFVDEIWKLDPRSSVFGRDNELHALAMLEYGMCSCKADILREYLAEKCIYRSEYADRMSVGANRIIDRLNDVASNLDDTNQYTCKIILASEALRNQDDLPNIYKGKWCAVEHQGDNLAAVIFTQLNGDAKISNILLSRDGNYLKLFESEGSSVAIRDIVPTNVKELLTGFYGKEETIKQMRDNETPDEDEAGAYVWKESDGFVREWLNNRGFSVTDTEIEDDCIGYACTRKQKDYAIYMYSYGKQPTVYLDAEYCQRLHSYPLSQDRMIIIVYLKVDAYVDEEGQKKYKVGSYGNTDNSPEMWILHNVGGRNILLFYPRPEIFEMIPRLMAAYNTQNLDVLKAICTEDVGLEHFNGGRTLNDGFYSNLSSNYERYGKMKMAYVRYNDVLFSAVPYLEDYCYISFSVTNDTDRICNIVEKPLDDNFRELLVTDTTPETDIGNEYPLISEVSFLPSDSVARFSVRMVFDNGEIRRYNFKPAKPQIVKDDGTPIEESSEYDEIGKIGRTCFTDKMFAHGKLVEHIDLPDWMGYRDYPQRGQGLSFVNGYSISTAELYFNSYPVEEFSYAGMDDVHVSQFDYADDGFGVGHIGNLDPQNPVYLLDKNTMTAKVIPAEYQDTSICIYPFCGGYSEGLVMVSTLNDIDLQYHHNLESCAGMWGLLDKNLNVKIAPQYIFAKNFECGHAIVCKGEWSTDEDGRYWCENEHWGVIDHDGNEIVPCQFDELYEIDGTDRLYFVHEGGWDDGHYAIFDCKEHKIILTLDFDFDMGYMFNECFVTDNDILVFVEHLPGEGKDLITAYDLHKGKYLVHQEENTERTFNGEKTLTVKNEQTGMDIVVF